MTDITEAARLVPQTGGGNRWYARIIKGDIWGSSGYYPADVLERDGGHAWPAGTPVFFDHPAEDERQNRPERSVRDLAGRIASTPTYERDGLYAEVEFYAHAAPIVREMAGDIGLSIRATASVEEGERDGRRGVIVTAINEGLSVDLVTKAGAGGALVSLMESARPLLIIDEAPAMDTPPATDPANLPTPHHEPPVPPAGSTTHVQEDTMPQIEEARLRQLEEAASRVQAIEAERDQARTELAEARRVAREAQAVQVITAAEAEHRVQFTPLERRGLTADLPTTDTGALDTDALARTVAEAAAEKAAATGAGQVHGYGSAPVTESTPITWDDVPGFQEA